MTATPARALVALVLAVAAAWRPADAAAPPAPEVAARQYVLYEHHTGQVLAHKDAEAPAEPASLTKIMTAYVAFEALQKGDIGLDDKVRISRNAWRTGGSRMFVEVDSEVRVEDLLHGIITQSGNDASVAIAEHIAGSEATFGAMMTDAGKRLGMTASEFRNASGLPDPQHYTTALDLARLASATIANFPQYYPWYALRSYTYNNITQPNRNRLLWWEGGGVDGLKTGHTASAGYCLVASGTRADMRLVAVVLGSPTNRTRFRDAQALLTWGYRFFESHRLFKAGEERTRVRVWGGEPTTVPVGLADDAYVTVARGRYPELSATLEVQEVVRAPVAKDTPLGLLRVKLGEDMLLERPLVALADAPRGGIVRRALDAARLWWERD
jgi:serine-type D-Ala-D-Ala carboxypeptidase (penicillin-binding protein 5/6)